MSNTSRGDTRLSRISTAWELIRQTQDNQSGEAQQELLDRYAGAARRYLLSTGIREEEADDLFQEFAIRFLSSLQRTNPAKGRFRQYVKTILINLVREQRRKLARSRDVSSDSLPEIVADGESPEFNRAWCYDLLARCWQRLDDEDRIAGKRHFVVLRLRADFPEEAISELVDRHQTAHPDSTLTAAAFRKAVQRARERFAELILDEVSRSLLDRSHESLIDEIETLGLMPYCRVALQKR